MRKRFGWFALAALCMALAVGLILSAGCSTGSSIGQLPKITSASPASGKANTQVTIKGSSFGAAQGLGNVHFGVEIAQVISWSDSQVIAKVPSTIQPASQPITVLTAKGASNEFMFTVTGAAPPTPPNQNQSEIEHITPVDAMLSFMKKKGININGWSFSVVKQSQKDPNWKIDVATKSGSQPIYFLLHRDNGKDWVVKDDGNAMTPQQLQADGAPSDLWSSAPAPSTELTAVQNYIKAKDQSANPAAWSLVVIKESKIDPNWEVVRGTKPGEGTMYFIVHYENGAWVVKDASSAPRSGAVPGEPSDIP